MPIFEVIDPSGRTLEIEGATMPNEAELNEIFASLQPTPTQGERQPGPITQGSSVGGGSQNPQRRKEDLGFIDSVIGTGELLATVGSATVAEPIAGVAGIVQGLNPFAEEDAGSEAVKGVREAITIAPGDKGIQVAQGVGDFLGDITPQGVKDFFTLIGEGFEDLKEATFQKFGAGAATAVATAPTLALEVIPGMSAIKKARKIPTRIADDVIDEVGDQARAKGADSIKTGIPPEAKTQKQIGDDLRKGGKKRINRLAEEVQPDQEILDAADALGVDLNPSHYSGNRAFIEVEQSLKSRPGSKLSVVEEKAIIDTGEAADKLITDMGGTTDKSLLDFNVKNEVEKNIAALNKKADIAYNDVNKAIPRVTKVEPSASALYIKKRLAELGGDKSLLNKSEKRLLKFAEDKNNPTYGALDQTRREVGDAIGKQKGAFRNDDDGILDQVYAVLSEDQQGVADSFGVGAQYQAGRNLVSTRKVLEKEAVALFGRELKGSILPKLSASATGLTKGDTSHFIKLINAVPKNRRPEVAASMLNELFASGSRKKGSLGSGFVSAFSSLNRNPRTKDAIFRHLPKDARKRFNDIGKVATGIFRSKALENNSRTARDIIAAMDNGGMFEKLYTTTAGKVISEGVTTASGLPGAGVFGTFVVDKLKKGSGTKTQAADSLLTSPAFKKSIEDAALGKKVRSEGIKNAPVFKRWLTAQPPAIRKEIAAIGFIPWLTSDNDERLSLSLQPLTGQ